MHLFLKCRPYLFKSVAFFYLCYFQKENNENISVKMFHHACILIKSSCFDFQLPFKCLSYLGTMFIEFMGLCVCPALTTLNIYGSTNQLAVWICRQDGLGQSDRFFSWGKVSSFDVSVLTYVPPLPKWSSIRNGIKCAAAICQCVVVHACQQEFWLKGYCLVLLFYFV